MSEPDTVARVFGPLVDERRWVAWKWVERGGKPTKPPFNPATGGFARNNDPSTWGRRSEAEYLRDERGFDGIGIELGGGLGGVDLDSSYDPETGKLDPWAQRIVDGFASYTEISPGGYGVKILAWGAPDELPANEISVSSGVPRGGKRPAIEAYTHTRYFCVTGRHLPGTPEEIRDAGDLADGWDRITMTLRSLAGEERNGQGGTAEPGAGLPPDVHEMLAVLSADVDHGEWLRVGMALHHGDPAAGLEVWDQWSATAPSRYPGRPEIERRWRSFRADRDRAVTIGTLVHMARAAGYRRTGPSRNGDADPAPGANGVQLSDFWAYMPDHKYIFVPTRELWPASSVNARVPPIPTGRKKEKKGKETEEEEFEAAATYLDRERAVEQVTWSPGDPPVIEGRLIAGGGWIDRPGVRCFNLYRPPSIEYGDASKAGPYLEHANRLFPSEAEHILLWLSHRVRRPHEKINHAIALIGPQGTGKDSLIAGAIPAVGPWNVSEVSPDQLMGRFNGFLKSVIMRVSEARDLGDTDRYRLYEHLKTYTAAPPDVLRVDEKHLREVAVPNVTGVVITSNHTDGIYLPPDDRRHYVALTERTKEDFTPEYWRKLWGWYEREGYGHVAAYLAELDLSDFDPKAPPPKTEGFWRVVDAGRAPEDAELADVLEKMQWPDVFTLTVLTERAPDDFRAWLTDRRNRRNIPHRVDAAGYVAVRNDGAKDGLWKVDGKRQVIYAKRELPIRDRLAGATRLMETSR